MKKIIFSILSFLLLCILMVSCHTENVIFPSSVQLWEGGPYWATTNAGAVSPEDYGSYFTFGEALEAEGFGWRLPSVEDIDNLKEKCQWEWRGDGYVVRGVNGNSIFIPLAGYMSRNINPMDMSWIGHYWSSSENAQNTGQAEEMYLHSVYYSTSPRGKDNALSVRMIRDESIPVAAQCSTCSSFTAVGNRDEIIATISVISQEYFRLEKISFTIDAPEGSISSIKIKSGDKVLCSKPFDGNLHQELELDKRFNREANLTLLADISSNAEEGSVITSNLESIESDSGQIKIFGDTESVREVILSRVCLYKPGDFGSKFWRIPALRQLTDGTLLAVNDRRNLSENDLPGCIDVMGRCSSDNGKSWSEPFYIAKNAGYMHGYGDPALVECEDGTVLCFFCGGETFTKSCKENPQRSFVSRSTDYGRTWSDPEEFTADIWGTDAMNPCCRECSSNFFSSGNSLLLTQGEHKGRVMVAGVSFLDGHLNNYVVFSDDCGRTWNVSNLAFEYGDESKLAELTDGRILLSVRQNGERGYAISEDGGMNWNERGHWPDMNVTACNGDLIRLDNGILMQSVPDSKIRENVTIYLSFDEGKTWPYKKCICHGPSQYSSLTVLKDGTIGAYIEEKTLGAELWFERFSLDWLLKGCYDKF